MATVRIYRPLLVTNNPACKAAYEALCPCLYDAEWDYGQVLLAAKEKVRQGWQLLSHPMAGSM